ncbi:hypothetical protein SprV_0702290800 [Sparganum proliferum]
MHSRKPLLRTQILLIISVGFAIGRTVYEARAPANGTEQNQTSWTQKASGLFRALPKVLDFQLRANGSDAEGSSNRREDTAGGKSGDHRSPELRLTDSHSADQTREDQRRSWKPEISVQYPGDERSRDRDSEAGSGEHELDTRQPLRESIGFRLPDISPPLIHSPEVAKQTVPTDWRRPYTRPTDSQSANQYQDQQRRSWIPKVSAEAPAHTGGRGPEDGRRNEGDSEARPGDGATTPRDTAGKTLTIRLPDITPPLIRSPGVAEPAIPPDWRRPYLRPTDADSTKQDQNEQRSWLPRISVDGPAYSGGRSQEYKRPPEENMEARSSEGATDPRDPSATTQQRDPHHGRITHADKDRDFIEGQVHGGDPKHRETAASRVPESIAPPIHSPSVATAVESGERRLPDSYPTNQDREAQRRPWKPEISVEWPTFHTDGRPRDERRNAVDIQARSDERDADPRHPSRETIAFRFPGSVAPPIHSPSVAAPVESGDRRLPDSYPTNRDREAQRRPSKPEISVEWPTFHTDGRPKDERRNTVDIRARSDERDADPRHPSRETIASRLPDSIAPPIHSPSVAVAVESGDRRLPDSYPTNQDREAQRRPWKPEISVEWPTFHTDGRPRDERRNAVDIQARSDERDADPRHPSRETIAFRFPGSVAPPIHSPSVAAPVESGDRRLPDSYPTNRDREAQRRPSKPEISVEWPTFHTDGRPKDERRNTVDIRARSDERDADPRHPSRETIASRLPDSIAPPIHSPSVAVAVESGDRRLPDNYPTNQDREVQRRPWKPEISVEWPIFHTDGRPRDERRNTVDIQARSSEGATRPRDSSDADHVEGQVHGRGPKNGSPETGAQAIGGTPIVTPEFRRTPTTRRGRRQRPKPQSLLIVYEDKPKPVVYEIVVNMPVQAENQEVPAGLRARNK